jgi:hypothetical protein
VCVQPKENNVNLSLVVETIIDRGLLYGYRKWIRYELPTQQS